MTPNPILKVLSTLANHHVQFLLMGGQACVFYGAAEFSRDTDIALLADDANLAKLQEALDELQAECIAVPPFDVNFLHRGHAVHFRCHHPEAAQIRLDIMSRMRNVDPFEELWSRRRTIQIPSGHAIDLMGIDDLVQAKKTQRDKDWPMIRRLIEAHFEAHRDSPTEAQVEFWLLQARTPTLLIQLAGAYPRIKSELQVRRPLLQLASQGEEEALEHALKEEEAREREADREYWLPLRKELENLRRQRRST